MSPTSPPAVSVLMPVYNAERYVEAAVNSILAQTLTNLELVIVNDGSTDRSGTILAGLARHDPRIRMIDQPNQGVVAALNAAALAARAPLLARMDADDLSLPTRIEKQVQYLNAHPECVAVGARIIATDPDDILIAEQFLLTEHQEIDDANCAGRCALAHPTVIMRRSALDIFPPYRSNFAEDLDLWLRLAERGRLANLPEPLLRYRRHCGSVSFSASFVKAHAADLEKVLNDAERRRGRTLTRTAFFQGGMEPVSSNSAPWAWSRMALSAGNYRSARLLARKAAAEGLSASGAVTIALAVLGPIGGAMLKLRQRRAG